MGVLRWVYDVAPGMYAFIRIWLRYIGDPKMVLRVIRKESRKILITHRVVDQLSPHHDSQFSAFSTEVLIRSRPGHNRSSSPFTTLADKAECRVASTGAGQPNY